MNFARFFALMVLVLLTGCGSYRPLYGTNVNGSSVVTELAGMTVAEQKTRAGQLVRNDILSGISSDGTSRYELRLVPSENTSSVSSLAGTNVKRMKYALSVAFELVDLTSGTVIKQGTSFSNISYDTVREPVADLQAANNARDRAAKEIGQDLRLRLAAALSSKSS